MNCSNSTFIYSFFGCKISNSKMTIGTASSNYFEIRISNGIQISISSLSPRLCGGRPHGHVHQHLQRIRGRYTYGLRLRQPTRVTVGPPAAVQTHSGLTLSICLWSQCVGHAIFYTKFVIVVSRASDLAKAAIRQKDRGFKEERREEILQRAA